MQYTALEREIGLPTFLLSHSNVSTIQTVFVYAVLLQSARSSCLCISMVVTSFVQHCIPVPVLEAGHWPICVSHHASVQCKHWTHCCGTSLTEIVTENRSKIVRACSIDVSMRIYSRIKLKHWKLIGSCSSWVNLLLILNIAFQFLSPYLRPLWLHPRNEGFYPSISVLLLKG